MHLRSIVIGVGILVVSAGPLRADFSVGAQVGAGPLTLNELEDFWDELDLHHDDDALALCWELSAAWQFAQRHAMRVSAGQITASIEVYYVDPSLGALTSQQNFEAIPVCASYEFELLRCEHGASTWLGLGAGLYLTELEGNEASYIGFPEPIIVHHSRDGNGYGFHGYLRQTAPISERLSLSGMIRGRWADGMAFDDNEGDIPVDFTMVDVGIGLEWRL